MKTKLLQVMEPHKGKTGSGRKRINASDAEQIMDSESMCCGPIGPPWWDDVAGSWCLGPVLALLDFRLLIIIIAERLNLVHCTGSLTKLGDRIVI